MAAQPNFLSIPERLPSDYRTLVLLLDGTGDKEDADVTNVIHLRNSLRGWPADNPDHSTQLVYYQQGIGTYTASFGGSQIHVPLLGVASETLDKAIAWSLSAQVTDAYSWLVEHYQPGDKISLFGFSRGAYTARALAGMLNAVALLPKDKIEKASDAFQLFDRQLPQQRTRDDPVYEEAWEKLRADFTLFKEENNCTTVFIDFLGCWDTVNSVGIVRPVKLRFTANNDIVRVFRHALALDEHRVRFKPNFWGRPKPQGVLGHEARLTTDVEEVWFAGCHTDVGGGSVSNDTRPNLAHIPLRWMIRECFKANTGIIFKTSELKIYGINPAHLYPKVLPRPPPHPLPENPTIPPPIARGILNYALKSIPFLPTPKAKQLAAPSPDVTEEEHDLLDCLAPAHDQLELNAPLWKPMEMFPMLTEVYQANAVYPQLLFKEESVAHMGLGRTIPSGQHAHRNKIRVHRTVNARMQAAFESGENKGQKYAPRGLVGYGVKQAFTETDKNEFEWVD